MAVKIRLSRGGSKKRPFYRVVAADARSPRDGKFLEKLGSYNPLLAKESEERLKLIEERVKYWLGTGAQPTDRVARLLNEKGLVEKPVQNTDPKKSAPGKKAQDRLKAKAKKEEDAKAAKEAADAEAAEAKTEESAA